MQIHARRGRRAVFRRRLRSSGRVTRMTRHDAITLLYIDDSDADIELLRALLGQRDIGVDAARTGLGGISAYDPVRHAAVAIDWNLCDMDGIEVAKTLRDYYPRCKLAFISGRFEEHHVSAAAALGIADCFEKKMSLEHVQRICSFVRGSADIDARQAV